MADTTQEFSTIIGPDCSIKGELTFESSARILGRVEGSITSKGKVSVGDGSKFKSTVKAKEITVEGQIEGNVEAIDRVELRPKGGIIGDIVAARMTMADGSSIDGHCRIGVNGHGNKGTSATELKPAAQPQPVAAKR